MRGQALEIGRVGQHREAGGAAGGVGAGEHRRAEIGADEAAARARLLDLGDEAVAARYDGMFECRDEPARRRARRRRRLDRGKGARRLGGRDLGALVGADAGEEIAHRGGAPLVMATSRSSARRAWPEAIDCAASATPARRSPALPAMMSAAALFKSTMSRSGPVSPSRMPRSRVAFSAGSPPLMSASRARGRPASSGVTWKTETLPSLSSAT